MAKVIKTYLLRRYLNDDGERHRVDGPAELWHDGERSWYIKGVLKSTMYRNGDTIQYIGKNTICKFPNGYKFQRNERNIEWPKLV